MHFSPSLILLICYFISISQALWSKSALEIIANIARNQLTKSTIRSLAATGSFINIDGIVDFSPTTPPEWYMNSPHIFNAFQYMKTRRTIQQHKRIDMVGPALGLQQVLAYLRNNQDQPSQFKLANNSHAFIVLIHIVASLSDPIAMSGLKDTDPVTYKSSKVPINTFWNEYIGKNHASLDNFLTTADNIHNSKDKWAFGVLANTACALDEIDHCSQTWGSHASSVALSALLHQPVLNELDSKSAGYLYDNQLVLAGLRSADLINALFAESPNIMPSTQTAPLESQSDLLTYQPFQHYPPIDFPQKISDDVKCAGGAIFPKLGSGLDSPSDLQPISYPNKDYGSSYNNLKTSHSPINQNKSIPPSSAHHPKLGSRFDSLSDLQPISYPNNDYGSSYNNLKTSHSPINRNKSIPPSSATSGRPHGPSNSYPQPQFNRPNRFTLIQPKEPFRGESYSLVPNIFMSTGIDELHKQGLTGVGVSVSLVCNTDPDLSMPELQHLQQQDRIDSTKASPSRHSVTNQVRILAGMHDPERGLVGTSPLIRLVNLDFPHRHIVINNLNNQDLASCCNYMVSLNPETYRQLSAPADDPNRIYVISAGSGRGATTHMEEGIHDRFLAKHRNVLVTVPVTLGSTHQILPTSSICGKTSMFCIAVPADSVESAPMIVGGVLALLMEAVPDKLMRYYVIAIMNSARQMGPPHVAGRGVLRASQALEYLRR